MGLLVLGLSMILGGPGSRVMAARTSGIPEGLEVVEGSTEYMDKKQYLYRLDIEEKGLLDLIWLAFNEQANERFGVVELIGRATVSVFHYCTTSNLADLFGDNINLIQKRLHKSLFMPMLWAALGMIGIKIIGRLWRRNMTAAMGDMIAVGLVMAAALLVTEYSDQVVRQLYDTTNGISAQVMVDLSGSNVGEAGSSYSAMAVGTLWKNMVYIPWAQLEFGAAADEMSESEVDDLLSTTILQKRQEIVNKKVEEDGRYEKGMNKKQGVARLSTLNLYIPIVIVKAGIFMICSVLRFVYQILTVIFIFLAPIVLALSLFPGFDFKIMEAWLKKILALQISAIVIAIFMSLLILVDNKIMSMFGSAEWMIGNAIEVLMMVCIFLARKKITGLFETIHRAVQMPRYAVTAMRNSGNVYRDGSRIGRMVGGAVRYGMYRKVLGAMAGSPGAVAMKKKEVKRPDMEEYKNAAQDQNINKRSKKQQEAMEEKWRERRNQVQRPKTEDFADAGKVELVNHPTSIQSDKVKAESHPEYEQTLSHRNLEGQRRTKAWNSWADDTAKATEPARNISTAYIEAQGTSRTGIQNGGSVAVKENSRMQNTEKWDTAGKTTLGNYPGQEQERKQPVRSKGEKAQVNSSRKKTGEGRTRALSSGLSVNVEEKERKAVKRPSSTRKGKRNE